MKTISLILSVLLALLTLFAVCACGEKEKTDNATESAQNCPSGIDRVREDIVSNGRPIYSDDINGQQIKKYDAGTSGAFYPNQICGTLYAYPTGAGIEFNGETDHLSLKKINAVGRKSYAKLVCYLTVTDSYSQLWWAYYDTGKYGSDIDARKIAEAYVKLDKDEMASYTKDTPLTKITGYNPSYDFLSISGFKDNQEVNAFIKKTLDDVIESVGQLLNERGFKISDIGFSSFKYDGKWQVTSNPGKDDYGEKQRYNSDGVLETAPYHDNSHSLMYPSPDGGGWVDAECEDCDYYGRIKVDG
ncbi:MAG: hypothetical protein IJU52_06275 [Clostridia bacterium]|nr:hypothetical protein [Clostridia bacterium]